jgi:hypothetical protein
LKIKFGEIIVSAFVSKTQHDQVLCTSPTKIMPGRVSIEMSVNGIDFFLSNLYFTYVAHPKPTYTQEAALIQADQFSKLLDMTSQRVQK